LRVQNEVKRAIQLRDIVTSLGPAYIKLGQALSIRPDILSPAAMNELQKLCDKVTTRPATTGRLRRIHVNIWSFMVEA
jgi:aarF domain-containing kinase